MSRVNISKASLRDVFRHALVLKRFSTWRQFFTAHGGDQVMIRYHHDATRFVTVEEFYSHIKARLLEEVSRDSKS